MSHPAERIFPDSLLGFGRHFERGLEMGLDDELFHAGGRGLLAELAEDFDQFVVHAHRQVGRQARSEAHALQFGVLLPVGTPGVGPALAAGHAVDRFENVSERFVLAHQGVAACDEDVAQLGVLLEIVHQAAQLVVPALLGAQGLELEIEAFALEIVHALARGAQPRRRGPSCRESGSPPPGNGGGCCARRAAATRRRWVFRPRRRPRAPRRGSARRFRPAAGNRECNCGWRHRRNRRP